jgi:hypothetical protein
MLFLLKVRWNNCCKKMKNLRKKQKMIYCLKEGAQNDPPGVNPINLFTSVIYELSY